MIGYQFTKVFDRTVSKNGTKQYINQF